MALMDQHGRAISTEEVARARVSANSGSGDQTGFGMAFDGASRHGTWFSRWPAQLQSSDRAWLPARGGVVARSRDLRRNETGAGSIVSRRKNSIVGRGWRRSAKPSSRALGIAPEAARELGQQIETEWKHYAYGHTFSCDAERRLTFGQLLRVAATHLIMDGEFLALVEWAPDEPTKYKTRLRIVHPDRLSNPMGRMDSDTLRGGVETNNVGVPVRYHIRERHPFDLGLSTLNMNWQAWERFATPLGRPQVLHGFDAEEAGQTRGVTRFASALKSFKALSRFTDATLQAAAINALILGYVSSSAGPEAVSESFSAEDFAQHEDDREEFYKKNPVNLGDAVFPVFPLGDEPKFATATKDLSNFDSFFRTIYRMICAELGVTYEEASMDYSSTNYSSARAAMLPAWAETVAAFGVLDDQLATPFHAAWLEEAFDAEYIATPAGAPDYYDAPEAYAEGRWIGPGKGYIDQTKEVAAAAGRLEAQISTAEDECAEQGKDYIEVLDQLAYEAQLRADRNLPPVGAAAAPPAPSTEGQTPPEDVRPGGPTALARLRAMADSPAHEASLDARPIAA